MPVTISWDNPDKTILLYQFENRWTWDELYAALNDAWRLLNEGETPVDIIMDMEHADVIPANAIAQFSKISSALHPRMRTIVIVGGGGMAASLLSIFAKVYGKSSQRYHVVVSREKAYALIHNEQRP